MTRAVLQARPELRDRARALRERAALVASALLLATLSPHAAAQSPPAADAGATLAVGMLFVGSGYGLDGGQPGNVLIAFAPRR